MLTAHQRPAHWIVRMNHRVRSLVFLVVLLLLLVHLWPQPTGPVFWFVASVQFLLYPHLVYGLARRLSDPLRLEMRALLLDPLLLGGWIAWLGFPLWIGFPIAIGTLISISVYRGWRGGAQALLALALGAAGAMLLFGPRFAPDTGLLTSALGMLALGLYLALVAQSAYHRGLQLRTARESLRQSERALQQQLAENQALQQQLHQQANQDALTGLYNRRYLDATIERELARCQRDNRPLSVLSLDIDHFKAINDRHGHPAGDQVLCTLARLLKRQARASDVVCRHSGEEFIVLLPNMTLRTALERAESCRQQMASATTPLPNGHIVATLSIGVAAYPEHGLTAHELLTLADTALYQAKQSGRNRVVAATAPPS